ncbi:unnamed protein product [Gongylonema pulchrum]|uniref:Cap-specific mRNA (nucleoside-2'-O-)-methyltransferase 2 n=1 Tax=Gongylonema pulchrum TaxID=637853 RepID=A0A183EPH0_9BILA|nr:unnamed protein product [Gongylonema pulchrum]
MESKYANIVAMLFSKFVRLRPGCDGAKLISEDEFKQRLLDLSDKFNTLRDKIPCNRLNEWRIHTSFTNPLRSFIREQSRNARHVEYSTQAFFKFYEILTRFSNLCFPVEDSESCFKTLHLCESPGAFICALNTFLALKKPNLMWLWNANRYVFTS